jgi:hypothetical protein
VLPDQAAAYCPWPNPVARSLTANSLQIGRFAIELVARSHEREQVTGCSLPVRAKPANSPSAPQLTLRAAALCRWTLARDLGTLPTSSG